MRKVLLFIAVIIGLGIIFLLASPVYYGKQAQFFVNKAVSSANQNYGKYGVHASIDSYQRNWYTSTAVIDIVVDNYKFKQFYKQYVDPNFDLKTPLIYKDVITVLHGPITYHFIGGDPFTAAYVQGYVQLPADLEQRLQLKSPLVVFDGRISYTDVFSGHILIPALSYDSPKLSLKWNGLSFFGNVSADLSHIAGEYIIQPANFSLKNFKNNMDLSMIVSAIKTHFDFRRTPSGLWVGHTQGLIEDEKIIFTSRGAQKPHNVVIEYKNVSTHMNLTLKKNNYSLAYIIKMADYNAFSVVKVTNITVDMELDNLNASVMQNIQDLVLRYVTVGDLQPNNMLMGQVVGLLPKLITQNTQIKINDISFDLPKGRVALQGGFSWPQYEAGMPVFTIGLLTHASLHVSVGKVLLDQLIGKINQQAKEQAAAAPLPTMEPGPVILPATHPLMAKSAAVKPATVTKTTPASTSAMSPYMSEMGQADGFLEYCLNQGYIVEKDQAYQTQLNYSAGAFTANGKKVKL